MVLLRASMPPLVADYDCKGTPPQSQPGVRARVRRGSQDVDSQQQETWLRLSLSFLRNLPGVHEDLHVRGEDACNMSTIPTPHRLTTQVIKHW